MGGASSQVSQLAPSIEEANKIPSEYRFSFSIGLFFNAILQTVCCCHLNRQLYRKRSI